MVFFLASGMNTTQICITETTEVSASRLICPEEQGLINAWGSWPANGTQNACPCSTRLFLPEKHG